MCVPNDEVETVLNFYLQDSNKTRTIQKLLQDDLEVGIEGFIRIYSDVGKGLFFFPGLLALLSWLLWTMEAEVNCPPSLPGDRANPKLVFCFNITSGS